MGFLGQDGGTRLAENAVQDNYPGQLPGKKRRYG